MEPASLSEIKYRRQGNCKKAYLKKRKPKKKASQRTYFALQENGKK
jgi:hypothetical protein